MLILGGSFVALNVKWIHSQKAEHKKNPVTTSVIAAHSKDSNQMNLSE